MKENMTKRLQEFVKSRKHHKVVFEKTTRKYTARQSMDNWSLEDYSY